jgi:hypothetical protein
MKRMCRGVKLGYGSITIPKGTSQDIPGSVVALFNGTSGLVEVLELNVFFSHLPRLTTLPECLVILSASDLAITGGHTLLRSALPG